MANEEKLELVTLRLFDGDTKRLEEFYPTAGYNKVVRTLVRRHIRKLEARLAAALPVEGLKDE